MFEEKIQILTISFKVFYNKLIITRFASASPLCPYLFLLASELLFENKIRISVSFNVIPTSKQQMYNCLIYMYKSDTAVYCYLKR